jgi:hypothetical protein
MRIRVPQFFVVNYARVGGAVRTGWFSHRVPGAGMAYFGFSDRALAARFAATADLDGPRAMAGRGSWLPTFLDYPDLRRQLETGLAGPGVRVELLALDPPSFDVPVVHVAPTAAVIQALSAHPEAESGIEVDFQAYNELRAFAQMVLPQVSSLPPWTRSEFSRCVGMFQERFPSKLALWEHIARTPVEGGELS